jgi:uncharacterized protein YegP (UPF0339 family)
MKFQIYRSRNVWDKRQWRWRLRAANGKIIASGEAYENKSDCLAAIDLVKEASAASVEESEN